MPLLLQPVRVLVPPITTGSLVASAATAITDAFADFPFRRRPILTNFTQPSSFRSYEDEVLRAAASRATTLHAVAASLPAGATNSSGSASAPYDAIFMTYATMQVGMCTPVYACLLDWACTLPGQTRRRRHARISPSK